MSAAGDILDLMADHYARYQIECDGVLVEAAQVLSRLCALSPVIETPSQLPVCRHLPEIAAQARDGAMAAIATAFAAYEPNARWRQNPNYTASPPAPGFLDEYGYVELVGRDRPWSNDRLAVGFLVLGPHTHYPPHRHPAAEVYHVVAGVAEWGAAGHPTKPRPVGSAIYHPPNMIHETRTLAEPLLALYCWTGDIGVAATLT